MKTFKEYIMESKTNSIKDVEKELKKKGEVHIILGSTDTWANIDDIQDGIGYGIDQFDNDIEIDLVKDKYQIVENVSAEDVEYYGQLANQAKKDKKLKKDTQKILKDAGCPQDIMADLTQKMK